MNNPRGIGTDIIEIERFQKAFQRTPQIADKLFSEKEKSYCLSKGKNAILHMAGRFAAKEAIAKALGTGFGKELSFLDLEIINNEKGQPEVFLSEKFKQKFQGKILISISHSETVAAAFALVF